LRVEVAFPVLDADVQRQVAEILAIQLADTVKAWIITAAGTSERRGANGLPKLRSQERLYELTGVPRTG
jgi:polyphosphate kinase